MHELKPARYIVSFLARRHGGIGTFSIHKETVDAASEADAKNIAWEIVRQTHEINAVTDISLSVASHLIWGN